MCVEFLTSWWVVYHKRHSSRCHELYAHLLYKLHSLKNHELYATTQSLRYISDAVCCSVLQCVVVCCSVLHCAAVCCSVLQCAAVCCSVLQCVAVGCIVSQCAMTFDTSVLRTNVFLLLHTYMHTCMHTYIHTYIHNWYIYTSLFFSLSHTHPHYFTYSTHKNVTNFTPPKIAHPISSNFKWNSVCMHVVCLCMHVCVCVCARVYTKSTYQNVTNSIYQKITNSISRTGPKKCSTATNSAYQILSRTLFITKRSIDTESSWQLSQMSYVTWQTALIKNCHEQYSSLFITNSISLSITYPPREVRRRQRERRLETDTTMQFVQLL